MRSINDELRLMSEQLAAGECRDAAMRLRFLADGPAVVVLPALDPTRDDLSHWERLARPQLLREVQADAWNLAAGVCAAENAITRETR